MKKLPPTDYTALSSNTETGTSSPSLSRSLSRGVRVPILTVQDKGDNSRSLSRERKRSEKKIKTAENSAPISHDEHASSIVRKLCKKKKDDESGGGGGGTTDEDSAPSIERISSEILLANTRLDELNRNITRFFTVIETQQTMLRQDSVVDISEEEFFVSEEEPLLSYYCFCCCSK